MVKLVQILLSEIELCYWIFFFIYFSLRYIIILFTFLFFNRLHSRIRYFAKLRWLRLRDIWKICRINFFFDFDFFLNYYMVHIGILFSIERFLIKLFMIFRITKENRILILWQLRVLCVYLLELLEKFDDILLIDLLRCLYYMLYSLFCQNISKKLYL